MEKFLVIGHGQIGRQLTADLAAAGHEALVLHRSARPDQSGRIAGDAADAALLQRVAPGCRAIFACLHAPYRPDAWRKHLVPREQTILNVAAHLGIPVIFPESVYAFGRRASDLVEGADLNPCTPLGDVRAELLTQRREHVASAISVVASDLVGPTATTKGSIPSATVIASALRGQTCWVLGDAKTLHSMTYIPDLTAAMVHSALNASELAPDGYAVLNSPTGKAITLEQLATFVTPHRIPKLRTIPNSALRITGLVSPTTRAIHAQLYLWQNPTILRAGKLETMMGLRPTAWSQRSLLPQECYSLRR